MQRVCIAGPSAQCSDSGTGERGPQLALMEPVVRTGKKQEHEYLYNTVSGGAKCSNLGGGKSGKETMEG